MKVEFSSRLTIVVDVVALEGVTEVATVSEVGYFDACLDHCDSAFARRILNNGCLRRIVQEANKREGGVENDDDNEDDGADEAPFALLRTFDVARSSIELKKIESCCTAGGGFKHNLNDTSNENFTFK